MQTTLILLKDGRNILVSDEEIKNCFVFYPKENSIGKIEGFINLSSVKGDWAYKIISGLESLPTLTYSDEVKEILRDKYGWIDVDEQAIQYAEKHAVDPNISHHNLYAPLEFAYRNGFETHQSITNKMFSLQDIKKAFDYGCESYEDFAKYKNQFLLQPIQLNVEVEITNNSIKVLKIIN